MSYLSDRITKKEYVFPLTVKLTLLLVVRKKEFYEHFWVGDDIIFFFLLRNLGLPRIAG